MTLEEAKKIFIARGFVEIDGTPVFNGDKWREACTVISEWLQSEECDAISRQAVRDTIFAECSGVKLDIDFAKVLLLQRAIKSLLPVTPTHKKGKWTNGDPICPCCGEDKFKDLDADIWSDWQPKYCPNCGARMAESEK